MKLNQEISWWWAVAVVVVVPLAVIGIERPVLFSRDSPPGASTAETPIISTKNGFDLSNAIIPREQIRSGGPPRDGIPSIDRPKFVPISEADFLNEEDIVISVAHEGTTRAYPLRILVWHEIVNDRIGEASFAVTYCPLCGTAMVFDRVYDDRPLTFGVSGLLYQSDVLMYDRETESLWSQLEMKCISGKQVNTPLKWLPSEHLTWKAWKEKYPNGEVLSTDTGFSRNYQRSPYRGYEEREETLFPVPKHRSELSNKTWVLGVIVNGRAKAYPVDRLPANEPVRDRINGREVTVRFDPASRHPSVLDEQTGEPLPSVMVYWFAWQAFYPETGLWSSESEP